MDTDPIIQAFLEEATELLADYEACLLELERNQENAETLNRIFRAVHTVKGNSSMLGLDDIAKFSHRLEDLLDQLRKQTRAVTPRVVAVLLSAGDVVKNLVERARQCERSATDEEKSAFDSTYAEICAVLEDREDGTAAAAAASPAPVASTTESDEAVVVTGPPAPPAEVATSVTHLDTREPSRHYEIQFRAAPDSLQRGIDPLERIAALREIATVRSSRVDLEDAPGPATVEPEKLHLTWYIAVESHASRDEIVSLFDIAVPSRLKVREIDVAELSRTSVVENSEPAREVESSPPAPVVEQPPVTAESAFVAKPRSPAPVPAQASGAKPAKATESAAITSLRVPVDKVVRLINLVGELVITQSMVVQLLDDFSMANLASLREAIGQMDRHARELRERIMAVRMIPIKSLFSRFQRLVHDLNGVTGKKAVLEIHGEDTELDKTVLEKIGDPLTHLIRNSLDHGLEKPEDRLAAGKAETGTVRLSAYQRGGNIFIEVSDDGRGLSRDKIVAKAIKNGLITADQQLSDDQINALIFRPGFSTAEQVTAISGRGVGMDVVKKNVESLGGTISIKSEVGRGTQFRIALPLTLAILDGQMLRVGGQVYILPLVSITESIQPLPNAVHHPAGCGEMIVVRDRVVPVIRLAQLFGIPDAVQEPSEGLLVIVESEDKLAALLVDELLAQQQVVIKSLEENYEKLRGVSGATILGDGRVALILDVPGMLTMSESAPLHLVA